MVQNYFFTSESVSHGHPDKLCDQISDMILDLFIAADNEARVAIETMATASKILISGEIKCKVNIANSLIENKVRELVKKIGYTTGVFAADKVAIEILLNKQSADIALGVDETSLHPEGAGDQGIMFGYACKETDNYMPAAIHYAHKILRVIFNLVKLGKLPNLGPDAKSQVTFAYENGWAKRVDTVLLSIQHQEDITLAEIVEILKPVIKDIFPENFCDENTKFLFNPTGRFIIGGPEGDVGLTGRKIIVDTYGGAAPHGGGAFSGKDPTKVDRSAAYIARYMAKNIVASGLAEKCLTQLSYAIGVAEPISIFIDCYDTGKISEDKIIAFFRDKLDLTPKGIRTKLKLNRPIFQETASFGHFGRDVSEFPNFTWEALDLVADLQKI